MLIARSKPLILITLISIIAFNARGATKSPLPFQESIYIDSDSLKLDRAKNTADFEGQVILWFEDMVLKTSVMQVIYKEGAAKKEIDKIIIPAKLTAEREKAGEILIADSAEYLARDSMLILKGNVTLLYNDHILKTHKLVYYTKLNQTNKFKLDKPSILK